MWFPLVFFHSTHKIITLVAAVGYRLVQTKLMLPYGERQQWIQSLALMNNQQRDASH